MCDEESMDIDTTTVHQKCRTYTIASVYNMCVIKQCYERSKWCDLTLTAEDRSFHAHRIVLSAAIPYFNIMLNSSMAEAEQAVIGMKEISAHTLAAFIDYAYTGNLYITVENVASLLMGASYLQLDEVHDFCKKYILDILTPQNCLFFLMFKNFDNCKDIGEAADHFTEQNFSQVLRSDEFLRLDVDAIINFLERDKLCVKSEREVYEGTMRWVMQSMKSRVQDLPRLINCIRVSRMSLSYLIRAVLPNDLIRNSVEPVKSAIDTLLLISMNSVPTVLHPPRQGCLVSGGIYLLGEPRYCCNSPSERIEIYRPGGKRWDTGAPMLEPARAFGLGVVKEMLYVFGGKIGQQPNAHAMLWDIRANQWYNLNCTMQQRSGIGVAATKDDLYLCGGIDEKGTTNLVERYIPYGHIISRVRSMRMPRCELGVCSMKGYVYAVGGRNLNRVYMSVERYDPRSDRWRFINGMNQKRCQHGVAELNGRLYACGGYDGSNALRHVEFYDPKAGNWYAVLPMIYARSRLAVVATAGRLWAIGGYDNGSSLSSVESYDPQVDKWSMEPSLEFHSGSVVAAAVVM